MANKDNLRMENWTKKWDENRIGFHKSEVHSMLQKHISRLRMEGQEQKIFVPLCGKTLDMKWLLDQGYSVVGLDGVRKAVEDFCSEHSIEYTEEPVPHMGSDCHILKSKDSKLKLYLGDIFNFNSSVEGTFTSVWDRGSLVALYRKDVKKYAEIIKDLLKTGGKCLVEVFEYDKAVFAECESPPPPHPMFEAEVRSLYEPECSVESIDRGPRLLAGQDIELVIYVITKK